MHSDLRIGWRLVFIVVIAFQAGAEHGGWEAASLLLAIALTITVYVDWNNLEREAQQPWWRR